MGSPIVNTILPREAQLSTQFAKGSPIVNTNCQGKPISQDVLLCTQEVEVKVLRWLHEEEASGVQYLEVSFCHVMAAKVSAQLQHDVYQDFATQ